MKQTGARNWPLYVGLGLAALDWLVALCWPQAYRSTRLYRRFSPWEEAAALCLVAASAAGFAASLAGAFRRGSAERAARLAVAGMVLNLPPFLVFGVLCRGLDRTGF